MGTLSVSRRVARFLTDERVAHLYRDLEKRYRAVTLPAHGWDHVLRCVLNAGIISTSQDCRGDIVIAATLLHDIGFLETSDPLQHHEIGARRSFDWTGSWGESDREDIAECVLRHKGEEHGFDTVPLTTEQRIVCDADRLEKTGYIGVMQGVCSLVEFAQNGWPEYRSLYEIATTLKEPPTAVFYTDRGRELARSRGGLDIRTQIFTQAQEELRFYYR